MKRFVGILLAAAAPVALTACGGGNDLSPPVVQHPENQAIWSALGGDLAAPAAVAGVVNAAVTGLLADPVEAPYFAAVTGNTSKSSAAHDTPARLEACLTLQFESLLGGPYTYPGPVKVAGDVDAQPEMCQDMTTAHNDVGVPGCVFDQFMVDLVATFQSKLPAADFAALTSTTNGTYPLTMTNSAGIPVGTKFQYSAVPTLFNLRSTITSATPGGPLYLPPTVATSCSG
jgi:predicted small lipoprotein YifL